ncbi:MAG: LysE family translocator [Cyanobacteria bacterium J06632_22]
MPDLSTILLFVSTSLVMQMMPGPATIYIAMRSLEQGALAGLASVCGIVIGAFFHVWASMLGISAVLMASAMAFAVIKYVGAAYLMYIGIMTLIEATVLGPQPRTVSRVRSHLATITPLLSLCRQGIMVNVLNPKAAIFFLAFLPQFVAPEKGPIWRQSLILGTIFALLGLLTGAIYVWLATRLRLWGRRYRRFQLANRYISGGTYIALGMTTAMGDRP